MNAPARRDAAKAGPFTGFEGVVRPDWIDANRHMNVAWYDHIFDIAESALFAAFAIDEEYIRTRGCGMFRLEKRIRYERELVEGDRLRIEGRIVSTDHRLVRHYHELLNLTSGILAASAEYTSIHVDLSMRKSARIADPDIRRRLDELYARHAALPPISTS